jgi:hypothetical protein
MDIPTLLSGRICEYRFGAAKIVENPEEKMGFEKIQLTF